MNTTRNIAFALLLLGVLALTSACSTSYRILSVEDHPNGEVTLMKTLTTSSVGGFYNTAKYNYWECRRSDAGLSCEKTCWHRDISGQWPQNAPQDGAMCGGGVATATQ
jgi:hypothetical protein